MFLLVKELGFVGLPNTFVGRLEGLDRRVLIKNIKVVDLKIVDYDTFASKIAEWKDNRLEY